MHGTRPRSTIPRTWMEVRARPEWLGAALGAGALLLFAAGLGLFLLIGTASRHASFPAPAPPMPVAPTATAAAPAEPQPDQVEAMTQALLEPFQERLQPLGPDQARAYNARVPLSTAPNPAARPFLWRGNAIDRTRAEDCLTAAIYYEADSEPTEGARAVAQVVLNRVRHFAYPKTVCGVVFQGAERPTGCQFTFTCDGSMARPIGEAGWRRAQAIARAALAGKVARGVGEATHYHADYVAPTWQPTLLKVAVIGQHIFYRGADGWGSPAAYTARYAGGEPDVPALASALALSPATAAPVVRIAAPPPMRGDAPAEPVTVAPPAPPPPPRAPPTASPAGQPAGPTPPPAAAPAPAPAPETRLPHAPRVRRLPMAG